MKTFTCLLAFTLICAFQTNAQAIEKQVLEYTYSGNFKSMVSGDLNGDSIRDFIGCNGSIMWYEGTGTATLGAMHFIHADLPSGVFRCIVGDIDEDGWNDIFYLAGTTTINFGWIKNPADGTDDWETHPIGGSYGDLIGIFDMDNDGDKDIVYEDNLTYLGWRENSGSDFTTTHSIADTYANLKHSVIEDFDHDGDTDWVGYFYDCCTKYFSNNENGTFTVSSANTSESDQEVNSVDVNGDGFSDIVYFYTNFQVSYFSPVTHTFGSPVSIGDLTNFDQMNVKDIDGDGDKDWTFLTDETIGANYEYEIYWIQNNGAGFNLANIQVLVPSIMLQQDYNESFFQFMDLDDDGLIDLFTQSGNELVIEHNNFPAFSAMNYTVNAISPITDMICFNIDTDSDNDILTANSNGGLNWYEYNSADGEYDSIHFILSAPDYPLSTNIKKKDIDGDGDFDILSSFTSADGSNEISYYSLSDGAGNYVNYEMDAIAFANVWLLDGDGDGDLDLAGMKSDYPHSLLYYENTGIASNLFAYTANLTPSYTWYSFVTVDIDNDGDDDIVGTRSSVSALQKIENLNGPATFAPIANYITTPYGTIHSLFTADFDNDLDNDFIFTFSTGTTYFAKNTAGTFTNINIGTFDPTPLSDGSHTALFDLNADGNEDIIYNKTEGGSGYKLSTGPGTFVSGYDEFSVDYGRFNYVDAGGVPDFIGTNSSQFYIQHNILMLAPAFTITYPTQTYLEENGASDGITFTFDQIPQGELIINVSPTGSIDAGNGEGMLAQIDVLPDSSALIPKTVTWNVPDDAIVEDVSGNSVHVSGDPTTWGMYAGLINLDFMYTITDNDLGLFLSADAIDITEGITSDTVYAHFNVIPDNAVTIGFISNPMLNTGFDLAVAPTQILPAGINGITPFKITTISDNDLYPGNIIATNLQMTVGSADAIFNSFVPDLIPVNITDDDIASIIPTYPTSSISEGVESFTATLHFTSAMHNNVTVTAYPDMQIDFGAGAGVPVSHVFPAGATIPANWNISGLAFDDFVVEGDHTGTATFSVFTTDADYAPVTIPNMVIDIDDNDAPQGINIEYPDAASYLEGTSGLAINISLFTNPNALVTIYATPDAQLDLGAGAGVPVPIIFDLLTDATAPHIVPLTIFDDYIVEGTHTGTVSFNIVTVDPVMAGFTIDDVTINITDDDEVQGVNLAYPAIDQYIEGTTGLELSLSLFTQPNFDVSIYATPDAQLDLGAGAGIAVPYFFSTGDDATIPQIKNISVVDDAIVEGDHTGTIIFTIVTADPQFAGYSIPNAVINISDYDDMQQLLKVVPAAIPYVEGTTGLEIDFSLQLTPMNDVTIYATPDAQLDLGAGAGVMVPIILSTGDATDLHIIPLSIAEDFIVEGDHSGEITYSIETTDPAFDDFIIANTIIDITDNDALQGVTINYPAADYFVEGSTGISMALALFTDPNEDVVIQITSDDQIDLGNGPGLGYDVYFAAGTDVTIPQVIEISIVDDAIVQGDRTTPLHFEIETDDPQFEGYMISDATIHISDNDVESAIHTDLQNNIQVYPSCSNGIFTIDANGISDALGISVLNVQGEVIQSFNAQGSNIIPLDIHSAASGMYFIRIMKNNEMMTYPVEVVDR